MEKDTEMRQDGASTSTAPHARATDKHVVAEFQGAKYDFRFASSENAQAFIDSGKKDIYLAESAKRVCSKLTDAEARLKEASHDSKSARLGEARRGVSEATKTIATIGGVVSEPTRESAAIER